jgi:hypothetical protein
MNAILHVCFVHCLRQKQQQQQQQQQQNVQEGNYANKCYIEKYL